MKSITIKPRHKFNAQITVRNGIKFHSKKEAEYYDMLKLLQKDGTVLFFLMQTRFHLPGNIKYLCDFQIFYSDGRVQFIDVKGMDTPLSKTKRKMVEQLYPVRIDIR
ncbi:MAG TPA: DUF1064 domain-containing protein [Desulfobacterales bacterium]|nr:DUF1064 domain-containing protein [Desulfobacterales bacterium]